MRMLILCFLFLALSAVESFTLLPYGISSLSSTTTSASGPTTTLRAAGPAVVEPTERIEETVKSEDSYNKGGWAVRLFNDPMNKREFVSMCLAKICGLTDGQAYQVMMAAHQNGLAVIGRYDFERAELYRDSLKEQGLVCDMIPVEED